jgi:type I restriction enzyme S subunit
MMGDDDTKTLTPKLRFPEFRKDGAWRPRSLSDLCTRIVEKVGDAKLTPVSITAGRGFVSQAEKFGRDIAGAQYKNYTYLRRGEFAYNKGNSNLYPQGCVYRLKEFDEAAASNAFICFRLAEGNASGFFEGLFEKNAHGRQLTRFLTSGARSDGLLNIKPEEFFSVEFPIPPRPAEQQKIADCLASLDELIAAQGRKVEVLRAHKKGLMQQLFPSEGETLPRLRFPEFRNAGEWETKPLAQIAENLDSKRIPITESERTKGDIPYFGASGIVDFVADYIFDEDLLCVSEDGANLITRTYPIAFSISGKTWVNNHAHVLRFADRARQTLVEAYLNAIDLRDFITGMAQPKLRKV